MLVELEGRGSIGPSAEIRQRERLDVGGDELPRRTGGLRDAHGIKDPRTQGLGVGGDVNVRPVGVVGVQGAKALTTLEDTATAGAAGAGRIAASKKNAIEGCHKPLAAHVDGRVAARHPFRQEPFTSRDAVLPDGTVVDW